MKSEIDSAVKFLFNMLRNGSVHISSDQMFSLRQSLESVLANRYQDHWFPDRPSRGSAYRCVRIVNQKLDRVLAAAAADAGVPDAVLERLLPAELTLWVDPDEVSYRIGEDGSVGVIYDARSPSIVHESATDDSSSDSLSSQPTRQTPSPLSTGSTSDRLSPDTVNYQYLSTAVVAHCGAS